MFSNSKWHYVGFFFSFEPVLVSEITRIGIKGYLCLKSFNASKHILNTKNIKIPKQKPTHKNS